MAIWNLKPQSIFSSLFVKPFNNFFTFFSGLLKPKQIIKKDDRTQDNKLYTSSSEMKILSTFPQLPINATVLDEVRHLRKEVAELREQVKFLKAEQILQNKRRAQERAGGAS